MNNFDSTEYVTMMSGRNWIESFVALFLAGALFAPAAALAESGDEGKAEQESASESEPTQEEKEKFAEFVKAGKEAYTNGKFKKAIPFFQQAYDIIPRPELKYRLALSYERSDQPAKALRYYREFLEEKPNTERRGAVEKTISELEKKLEKASKATVRIESSPSGADVRTRTEGADGYDSRGQTPVELTVNAGEKLEISIEKSGFESEDRTISVEAGETKTYAFELESTSSGTDAPSRAGSAKRGGNPAAVAALIVGGVGAVGGGTFYGIGRHCSQESDGKRNCTRGLYNGSVIGSYIGGGLGVAGLGTAAILWLTGGNEAGQQAAVDASRPQLRIHVTPRSVGLSGRF